MGYTMKSRRDTRQFAVRVPARQLERLDKMAAERSLSRSEAVRALIEGGLPEVSAASLPEALTMLSESARSGSVQAQIALARTLLDVERRRDPAARRRDELAARRRAKEAG
jgi:predicted DNA-binding protein